MEGTGTGTGALADNGYLMRPTSTESCWKRDGVALEERQNCSGRELGGGWEAMKAPGWAQ
eukprot:scaffold24642_cov68-Cyclotella_meneghiniana.AAC.3